MKHFTLSTMHDCSTGEIEHSSSFCRYHSFFQTLMVVWREEGMRGLYGGMSTHLLRVVPNTAVVFLTYEAVVKFINHHHDSA